MLPVSENQDTEVKKISFEELNSAPLKKLVEFYKFPQNMALIIEELRPFEKIEDLNKFGTSERAMETLETVIDKLVVSYPTPIPVKQEVFKNNIYMFGDFSDQEGNLWIFISTGLETLTYAKVIVKKQGKYELDLSSFHLFSTHFLELKKLSKRESLRFTQVLHTDAAKAAGKMELDKYPGDIGRKEGRKLHILFNELAHIIRFIQQLSLPRFNSLIAAKDFFDLQLSKDPLGKLIDPKNLLVNTLEPNKIVAYSTKVPAECDTNGCTWTPDGNWKECCDQHDVCYCIGGTERDRRHCDSVLFRCIRRHAGVITALVYYAGVRALSASHFNYHDDVDVSSSPIQPIEGEFCQIQVVLHAINYWGDDIGDDVRVWCRIHVILDGQVYGPYNYENDYRGTGLHNGQVRYEDDLIFVNKFPNGCGKNLAFLVEIKVQEYDRFFDDGGNWNAKLVGDLTCNTSEYWFNRRVNVPEHWNVAHFDFSFRVTMECLEYAKV